jgi:kynureninase
MDQNIIQFENTKEFAIKMDENDSLSDYRKLFYFPKKKTGGEVIYFCSNSLGLQPKGVKSLLNKELLMWRIHGVEGHFKGTKWMSYHEYVSELCSFIVGANKEEVIIMNTLTVNLHFMMISFYRPTPQRHKILIEKSAFPSDQYAVKSQISLHGYDPSTSLIEVSPREGEITIRPEDIFEIIEKEGNSIALILFAGVNYLSGQVFEFKNITQKGHEQGCMVGFDLAHAFANVELHLHEWNVDFAVWCTYKYGCGGPGAIAGAFVHEKHFSESLPRLAGWWGHDKATRFQMDPDFVPIASAEGWQVSNPPIFSITPLINSFEIFLDADITNLFQKSKMLTNYLEFLLINLNSDKFFISPEDSSMRGCQISIHIKENGHQIHDKLTNAGIICDWREPNVIRVAPFPLYNKFIEVYEFMEIFKSLI